MFPLQKEKKRIALEKKKILQYKKEAEKLKDEVEKSKEEMKAAGAEEAQSKLKREWSKVQEAKEKNLEVNMILRMFFAFGFASASTQDLRRDLRCLLFSIITSPNAIIWRT